MEYCNFPWSFFFFPLAVIHTLIRTVDNHKKRMKLRKITLKRHLKRGMRASLTFWLLLYGTSPVIKHLCVSVCLSHTHRHHRLFDFMGDKGSWRLRYKPTTTNIKRKTPSCVFIFQFQQNNKNTIKFLTPSVNAHLQSTLYLLNRKQMTTAAYELFVSEWDNFFFYGTSLGVYSFTP